MEICPEVKELLTSLARRCKVSEAALVERCIRHLHKRIAGLDKHREANPHYGLTRTPEYQTWYDMMRRCFDDSRPEFVNYGGRGITVAMELRTLGGFMKVMGPRPRGKSLERINNDGNYEPRNLRWATPMEQNSNTRASDLITYQGKTQTLSAWARELGMSQTGLWMRLYRHKWSIEDAFTRPVTRITAPNGRVTSRKLTDAQIIEIARSSETQRDLAARFGIVQGQVSRIKSGKRWGRLTGL